MINLLVGAAWKGLFVLGVASLERLIEAVEDWERRLTKGD